MGSADPMAFLEVFTDEKPAPAGRASARFILHRRILWNHEPDGDSLSHPFPDGHILPGMRNDKSLAFRSSWRLCAGIVLPSAVLDADPCHYCHHFPKKAVQTAVLWIGLVLDPSHDRCLSGTSFFD